jgi:hypothetical protein
MNSGLAMDCGCCDQGRRILFDGSFDSGPGTSGAELTRFWGDIAQAMLTAAGLDWEVVYYPDVAGQGFNLNNYAGIHLVMPQTNPAWWADLATWTPADGAPKRVMIHGDANGDSAAPYDYGTAVADWIDATGTAQGFALRIGADAADVEDWVTDAVPLAAGVSLVSQIESSEVTGGTRVCYAPSEPTTTMAEEAVGGISWVVAGTPSWLEIVDPDIYDNYTLLSNLHTVAV